MVPTGVELLAFDAAPVGFLTVEQIQSEPPQGGVISPLLANLYLNPLDHQMEQVGGEMVRYADDFVILCRTEAVSQTALTAVQAWVSEAGLTLHPEKTQIVDAPQGGGFDFLGYHFERGMKWPRKKSLEKLKEKLRAKTPRLDGRSLKDIVADVNWSLRGWYGYFSTVRPIRLRRWTGMCGGGCGVCCNGGVKGRGMGRERRTNAGRVNGLPDVGCCPWQQNTNGRVQS